MSTEPTTQQDRWAAYREGWRRRDEEKGKALEERLRLGREAALRCARVLADQYAVRRVILIGSMATGRVHEHSDIDLAVEGLPAGAYLDALGRLSEELPPGLELDLVPVEDATPPMLRFIAGGELLYDAA